MPAMRGLRGAQMAHNTISAAAAPMISQASGPGGSRKRVALIDGCAQSADNRYHDAHIRLLETRQGCEVVRGEGRVAVGR